MSGYTDRHLRYLDGETDFLRKPLTPRTLLDKIAAVFGNGPATG